MKARAAIVVVVTSLIFGAAAAAQEEVPAVRHGAGDAAQLLLPTLEETGFHAQPASGELAGLAAGTLLDVRAITFHTYPGIPSPEVEAWQFSFVSEDESGRPLAAVATVARLREAAVRVDAVVSLQLPYNSLGRQCSASKYFAGSTDNADGMGSLGGLAQAAISEGWTVVLPDHLGPDLEWGAPHGAAAITRDALRAVRQVSEVDVEDQTPMAAWGYSGGSAATLWLAVTAHEAGLPIVAVAAGGITADVGEAIRTGQQDPVFGPLILSAVLGFARAYPDLLPVEALTDEGRSLVESLRDGCYGNTSDGSARPAGTWDDFLQVDFLDRPEVQSVFAANGLPRSGYRTRVPTFLHHGEFDQVVPVSVIQSMYDQWCAAGSTVILHRTPGDHIETTIEGFQYVRRFFANAFSGAPWLPPPTAVSCVGSPASPSEPTPAATAVAPPSPEATATPATPIPATGGGQALVGLVLIAAAMLRFRWGPATP